MMSLALGTGETVKVTAEGTDEEAAVQDIEDYLSGKNSKADKTRR